MTGRSQRALTVMYNWVSSAYTIQRRPWSRITSSICAKKTAKTAKVPVQSPGECSPYFSVRFDEEESPILTD